MAIYFILFLFVYFRTPFAHNSLLFISRERVHFGDKKLLHMTLEHPRHRHL